MTQRGRPITSPIRNNLVEILYFLGEGYGYNLHKLYCQLFPPCTNESIYYHLKKGVAMGVFELIEIKQEKGQYSWGENVEKSYYKLGKNASPKMDLKVKEFIERHHRV